MKAQLQIIFVLSIITICLGQKTSVGSEQHTTIVEGNHFYSNYQLSASYNIASVDVTRPIILILRKKDDNQIFDNPITINLISGDKSIQCKFASFQGMCYLNNLPNQNMVMKLKCDHLPCQLSWTILQPSMKKVEAQQNIQQMYDISGSSNHMIAMISCNNPEVKDFNKLVTTFSENQYVRGYTNNIIYLLFKKYDSGHLFFKIDPVAKACAQMAIHNAATEMKQNESNKDFVFANESSIYQLQVHPQNQFRIDCSYHEMTKQAIKSQLILKLTGQKNGVRQVINNVTVKPPIPISDFEFNWAIPAIPTQYTKLQVQAKSSNAIIIFNFLLSLTERIQIEESEHSYFKLAKGGKLLYKLIGQPSSDSSEEVLFILSKPNEVKVSRKSCSKRQGCQFQIEALEETQSALYAGKTVAGVKKGEAIFFDFKGSVTRKIRDLQIIYLRTPLKKDQVVQVLVNNPNVIIRASSDEKCPVPTTQCYEHIANSNHHFIYEPKKDGNLLMAVQGLDNCQFTVSVIDQGTDSIQLKDGEPFMYMFDDKQNYLNFKFSIPQKIGTSFNLISPLNDLILVVNNGKSKANADQHSSSTDGYISFTKQELESNDFKILVEKTPEAKNKYVHFTLIATTSGANLRLDPGVAHTESLKPNQFKDFVFQFDKKGDYIINFYTPNVEKNELKVKLMVNNQDKWTDGKVKSFTLTDNSDVLNLKDISQSLCIQQGDIQCQIFVRIVNSMKIEIDVTLTLLVKDSVIQLKDGLWQTYAINTIAQTSHFYFLPKAKNTSIDIMYKSSLVDVGISYTLWKSDKENIDPSEWPFPAYKEDVDDKFSLYKSVNHIVIDHQNIKGCWPECVILLSLYKKKSGTFNSFVSAMDPNHLGNFSIMAANKMLDIPEKTRIQVTLKENQQKYMMIDLKYSLKKQALTFFVNEIIGSFSLFANVYSQKNPRCPSIDEHDFNFGEIETQIRIQSINNKREDNDMSNDQDSFLCILATGYLESKFTFEYTSDQQIIKLLHFDQFQRFSIKPKQVKYFQLEANQQYQLKLTRQKGYFYVKIAVCKDEKDKGYEECLQQLQESKDRGKQIITKTEEFAQEPCTKCIVFVRIDADDPAQGVIHVQSKYSMVELKQKDTISDFTNQNETNKYSITAIKKQEIIINVAVTEGNPVVKVTNYGQLNIEKQKDPKTNNILIVIPPEQTKQNTATSLGNVNYDSFTYSNTFRYLVLEIKSKDPKLATAYTLSYSSGQRETYLEDGLVVSYTLQAKKKAKFLYKNPSLAQHGYLSVSMAKSSTIFNLQFNIYQFSDPNDEDTKVDVTPPKPPMRKHTPNPTVVYSLPVSKLISIQIESENEQKITLMVLHQELVILPFDQQFPFEMHQGETINLITDVNNAGYLLLSLRKCDKSSPDFGYTFDYDSFQKGQFQYTTNLADDPKFQFYIKASKIGTLYMQMNSTDENGLFSISVHYNDSKIKGQKAKVGKNGILQYNIIDSNKARVSFAAVVCSSGSKCQKQTKYYWMAGNNIQDVYTQTVCPYSFFQVLGIVSSQPINVTQINQRPDQNGMISFDYPYKDHVSYLSVKAVNGNDQIYYQPIQIITLWGTVSRAGRANKLALTVTSIFICLVLCICYRKFTKPKGNQYEEIRQVRGSHGFDQ